MPNQFDHGDDGYKYSQEVAADFSTNAWYLGPDPLLLEHLKEKISLLATYPEPYAESLVQLLSDKYQINNNGVLAFNGTIEAIFLIARYFTGKKSRIISPTFSEYEHACQVHNHSTSFCGLNFIKEGMQTDFDVLWICNPNNPTGQVIKPEVLFALIRNNPQTTFVIDEAYADYCMEDISLEGKVGQIENLIILKSLTKNNCLPGLRLGYILCYPNKGKQLKAIQSPWSVNALAVEAGKYVLNHPRITMVDLLAYHSLKNQLMEELKQLGCEVQPSQTGYFLVRLPIEATVVKEYLMTKYGLLVRDASNFRTLSPYHIRIASLSAEKNQLLVAALKECLSSIKIDQY